MKKAAAYTNCGGREQNEDSYGIWQKNGMVCAVAADGLGGHGGGAEASAMAVETVKEEFNNITALAEVQMQEWFDLINRKILEERKRCGCGKTTLVILCMDDTNAVWAHAGDSRLYHFKNGKIETITVDHSVTQMAVLSGEITREEMRQHEDRNKLLRAIGRTEEIKAETAAADIEQGEHCFLLCTDGFWEYVYETEMEELLAKAATPGEWLRGMYALLEKRVSGEHDNNTALAIWSMPTGGRRI